MFVQLYNSGVDSIYINYSDGDAVLKPRESINLPLQNGETRIRLSHIQNDKFSSLWYVLTEMFTLEQMRTVLVVDGEYVIKTDRPVKVKNHEYVFDKNISYETFVFSSEKVIRKHLEVAKSERIKKRAKILYLFGGLKSFLPISFILTVLTFVSTVINYKSSFLSWLSVLMFGGMFVYMLKRYLQSLRILDQAITEKSIMEYMNSERKEFRKPYDDIVQKQLDINAGNDTYI